jgi:hypothetical protein
MIEVGDIEYKPNPEYDIRIQRDCTDWEWILEISARVGEIISRYCIGETLLIKDFNFMLHMAYKVPQFDTSNDKQLIKIEVVKFDLKEWREKFEIKKPLPPIEDEGAYHEVSRHNERIDRAYFVTVFFDRYRNMAFKYIYSDGTYDIRSNTAIERTYYDYLVELESYTDNTIRKYGEICDHCHSYTQHGCPQDEDSCCFSNYIEVCKHILKEKEKKEEREV